MKMLHIIDDKTWDPDKHFLGSTKDIKGRAGYFEERGIERSELRIPQRGDFTCKCLLEEVDLSDTDIVLTEHPRYPMSLNYLRSTYPKLRIFIRGHNAEFLHQLHVAAAFLRTSSGGKGWRLIKARLAIRKAIQRLRFDFICARLADGVVDDAGVDEQRSFGNRFLAFGNACDHEFPTIDMPLAFFD